MFEVRALGYVACESPNYEVWTELGPSVFAMQLGEPVDDGGVRLRIDDYAYRISVHPGDTDRLRALGWELADEREIDRLGHTLTELGVDFEIGTPEQCERRCVSRFISVVSPGGICHELFTGALSQDRSFTPPRRHGGFVTGEQGLGHVVVRVPDPDAENEFLRNVLRFRLTDAVMTPMGKVDFFHVNSRHHSIAALEGPTALSHVMVQTCELDDVGIAYDLVQAREDLPIVLTLGRHSTDRMLSFYVQTPTGFNVEYGWGGRTLDDSWTPTRSNFPAEIWGHKPSPAGGRDS